MDIQRRAFIKTATALSSPCFFITHDQIMAGGRPGLVLVEKPNQTWGGTVVATMKLINLFRKKEQ